MSRKIVSTDNSKQNIWKTVKTSTKTGHNSKMSISVFAQFLTISAKKILWKGNWALACDPN